MRELKKPKKDKTRVWCPGGNTPIGGCNRENERGSDRKSVRYERCPVCNQRFELYARDTEPEDSKPDIHYSIPRHKAF